MIITDAYLNPHTTAAAVAAMLRRRRAGAPSPADVIDPHALGMNDHLGRYDDLNATRPELALRLAWAMCACSLPLTP